MPTTSKQERRYHAFISYSHRDKKWGHWLHRTLEGYRPPRGVTEKPRRIKPVFRDDEEAASSADLSAVIARALEHSDALVVICSPNSAKSQWVDKEIRDFKSLGKQDNIYPLIIEGIPHDPQKECFPPSLKLRAGPDGVLTNVPAEPLAVDVRIHGKRDSLLKLAAGLLGVHYDLLKRRDRARTNWRIAGVLVLAFTLLSIYAGTILIQQRAVNTQISSILSALARESTDDKEHGRAMRFGILSARASPLFPPVVEAEPTLARAAHHSTLEAVLPGHRFAVYSASFDSTGNRLVTGAQDKTVRIWKWSKDSYWIADGAPIETGVEVMNAQFVESDQAIVVQPLGFGTLAVWRRDESGWRSYSPFENNASIVRSYDINFMGNTLVIGHQDSTLSVWRWSNNNWSLETKLPTESEIPVSVAVLENGTRIAAGFHGGTLRIWRQNGNEEWNLETALTKFQVETTDLEFNSDGGRLVAVGMGGDVRVLATHVDSGWSEIGKISGDRHVSIASFLPPNGKFLLTNGTSVAARMWAVESDGTWVEVDQFGKDSNFSRAVTFTANKSRFVTAGNDTVVRVWTPGELGTWPAYAKIRRGIGLVRNVRKWTEGHTQFRETRAVSSGDRRVATSDVYGIARIRDTATNIDISAFDVSGLPDYVIEFSDDDDWLVVRSSSSSTVLRKFPTRLSVSLSGEGLIKAICAEKLPGSMSIVLESDARIAPLLSSRINEDVCNPPSWWVQTKGRLSTLSIN